MGAGLPWGRRWPLSWESVYLKALSSLSVSPFFFPPSAFSSSPLWREGASAFPKALRGGATLLTQPWEEGPVPTGLLLLFFFWAV